MKKVFIVLFLSTSVFAYDIYNYCKSIAQSAGGSYSIEEGCIELEKKSRATLSNMTIPTEIKSHCQYTGDSTGSYSMLLGCIELELQSKEKIANQAFSTMLPTETVSLETKPDFMTLLKEVELIEFVLGNELFSYRTEAGTTLIIMENKGKYLLKVLGEGTVTVMPLPKKLVLKNGWNKQKKEVPNSLFEYYYNNDSVEIFPLSNCYMPR